MYYYRHGEVIFASLLPDLPLEPAKRPSAGTPSLFLIDRDPIRSRSSFCVSDPRQLTAETEDVKTRRWTFDPGLAEAERIDLTPLIAGRINSCSLLVVS